VARNRKRAKERRARQPVASGRVRDDARSSFAPELGNGDAAPEQREELDGAGLELAGDGAPAPIEHAAPDAELAEARLAQAASVDLAPELEPEEEVAEEEELVPARVETARPAAVGPRPWLGARLLAFLEGSWRELQRVQWPDRRQVMQATGVVIGFVIVASVFLGVAGLVAQKVVSFVLNGHF
jgi:preprotein translocase subunit SecE